MNSLRSTLVLLLVAICGGVYIYRAERGPIVGQGDVVLLRAPQNEVTSIKFWPSNLELHRVANTWHIQNNSAHLSALADPDAVQTLLNSVELVQSDAPIEGAANSPAFGLNKKAPRLELNGQNLILGAHPGFDTTRVYARSGNQTALVPAILLDQAKRSFDFWRDAAVLRFNADQANQFSLQTTQFKAQFHKDNGTWMLTKPLNAMADRDTVEGFLKVLAASRVAKWLDETGTAAQSWGLDTPQVRLIMDNMTLDIGKKANGGYAARNSTSSGIFLLPERLLATFQRPLRDWRDKKVAHFALNSATRLEIKWHDQRKVLVKNGKSWQFEGLKPNSQSQSLALDVLEFVSGLRAQDFVDKPRNKAAYGLEKPVLSLSIVAGLGAFELGFGQKLHRVYVQELSSSPAAGTIFDLGVNALESMNVPLQKLFPGRNNHDLPYTIPTK